MKRYKYPRTYHLPWSAGATSDDKTHSLSKINAMFSEKEVVVTEKLDGENSSIYADGYTHARSIDSAYHSSRSRLKVLAAEISYRIPKGFRLCGENVYAKHSIEYTQLQAYFYLFSIFDGELCLSWNDTKEYAELLDLALVPVLYQGTWCAKTIQNLWDGTSRVGNTGEGYVVRLASSFPISSFAHSVAKFVRPNHVQTNEHWMRQQVVPNKLRSS